MKEIEDKLYLGEGNQKLGGEEMKELLLTFKLDNAADICAEGKILSRQKYVIIFSLFTVLATKRQLISMAVDRFNIDSSTNNN